MDTISLCSFSYLSTRRNENSYKKFLLLWISLVKRHVDCSSRIFYIWLWLLSAEIKNYFSLKSRKYFRILICPFFPYVCFICIFARTTTTTTTTENTNEKCYTFFVLKYLNWHRFKLAFKQFSLCMRSHLSRCLNNWLWCRR